MLFCYEHRLLNKKRGKTLFETIGTWKGFEGLMSILATIIVSDDNPASFGAIVFVGAVIAGTVSGACQRLPL